MQNIIWKRNIQPRHQWHYHPHHQGVVRRPKLGCNCNCGVRGVSKDREEERGDATMAGKTKTNHPHHHHGQGVVLRPRVPRGKHPSWRWRDTRRHPVTCPPPAPACYTSTTNYNKQSALFVISPPAVPEILLQQITTNKFVHFL